MAGWPETGHASPVEKLPAPPLPPELVAITDCWDQAGAASPPARSPQTKMPRTQTLRSKGLRCFFAETESRAGARVAE